MSVMLRRKEIIELVNSSIFRELQEYYQTKTIFKILKIDRKEDTHNDFLAWVFNPKESHGLGDYSVRRFLEVLILALEKNVNKRENTFPIDWIDNIVTGNYTISNVNVSREKYVNSENRKNGRIDIFIEFSIENVGGSERKKEKFRIIIENKVNSKEHDEQTVTYFEWANSLSEVGVRNIFVFLTPLSNVELDKLNEPECACKKFIQLNYQYLADYVIQSCSKQKTPGDADIYLKMYMRSLSYPEILSDDENQKGDLIMAVSAEERELLLQFWETNKEILTATIKTVIDSPDIDLDDETRKNMAAAMETAAKSKKNKYYDIKMLGEEWRGLNNRRAIYQVVCSAIKGEIDLAEIIKLLPSSPKPFFDIDGEVDSSHKFIEIAKEQQLSGANAARVFDETRWFVGKNDTVFVYKGKTYALSNQWTSDVYEIIKNVFEQFPLLQGRIEITES